MKAIRTQYGGIMFRSKLEAQWAKFFDSRGIPWLYEPEGYEFKDGTKYLPDFWLPDSQQWFEAKGVMTDFDRHKIEMLCQESFHDVVVGYPDGEFEMCDMFFDELHWYSKGETYLNKCQACEMLSFMNAIGRYHCQCCGAYDGDHYIHWIMNGDKAFTRYEAITTNDWRKFATIDVRQ